MRVGMRETCMCMLVAEAFMPSPSAGIKLKVYASHAFSDRERVDSVMKQYVSFSSCLSARSVLYDYLSVHLSVLSVSPAMCSLVICPSISLCGCLSSRLSSCSGG